MNGNDARAVLGIVFQWLQGEHEGHSLEAADLEYELRQAGYGPPTDAPSDAPRDQRATVPPVAYAAEAAEAVRRLNHATQAPGPDWEYPSHAYSVVGSLLMLAQRLPQAIEQAAVFVEREHVAGRVEVPQGGDVQRQVDAVRRSADVAQGGALEVRDGLKRIQNALGTLGHKL